MSRTWLTSSNGQPRRCLNVTRAKELLGLTRGIHFRKVFGKLDHSEFMVLAFQLYDEYRKSILGVDREKALVGECPARMDPALAAT